MQVVMDQETGKPRGFGFVTFEDVRDAQDAVSDARGKVGACCPNLLSSSLHPSLYAQANSFVISL